MAVAPTRRRDRPATRDPSGRARPGPSKATSTTTRRPPARFRTLQADADSCWGPAVGTWPVIWKRRQAAEPDPNTLFDPRRLDLIAQSATGVVYLIIVQDQPWSNHPKQRDSLVQKIEHYVHHAA